MSLEAQAREVEEEISAVTRADALPPMRKAARIAELNIRLCHIRARQAARAGHHDEERSWLRIQAEFMTKQKAAIAAENHDLIHEVYENQKRSEDQRAGFKEKIAKKRVH